MTFAYPPEIFLYLLVEPDGDRLPVKDTSAASSGKLRLDAPGLFRAITLCPGKPMGKFMVQGSTAMQPAAPFRELGSWKYSVLACKRPAQAGELAVRAEPR